MKTRALAAALLLTSLGTATAGGQSDSLGVGAEVTIRGVGGLSANYDLGDFHVGGFLGFADGGGESSESDFTLGARFFYHLHATAMSDFGVGGTFALYSDGADGMGDSRASLMYLEPAFQIRLFVASNVAMSFTAGITLGFVDAGGFAIGGQGVNSRVGDNDVGFNLITGAAGIHYYFF